MQPHFPSGYGHPQQWMTPELAPSQPTASGSQPSGASHASTTTAPTFAPPRPASRAQNVARLNRAFPDEVDTGKVSTQLPQDLGHMTGLIQYKAYCEILNLLKGKPRLKWNAHLDCGLLQAELKGASNEGIVARLCASFQCKKDPDTNEEKAVLSVLAIAMPDEGRLTLLGEYVPNEEFDRRHAALNEARGQDAYLVRDVLVSLDKQYPLTLTLSGDGTARYTWHPEPRNAAITATAIFEHEGGLHGLLISFADTGRTLSLGQVEASAPQNKGKGVDRSAPDTATGHLDEEQEAWEIDPSQYRSLNAPHAASGVGGPALASTSGSHAPASTDIFPLRDVEGGIETWLDECQKNGEFSPADISFFRTVSRLIQTKGIALSDLHLNEASPRGLSLKTKQLLYASLVAHRGHELPQGQRMNPETLTDGARLNQGIEQFASDNRLRLPPHILVGLPPAMLRNAIVQAMPGFEDMTYASLDQKYITTVGAYTSAVRKVLIRLSALVLAPYGSRANNMYRAAITLHAPRPYWPVDPFHSEFYGQHSGRTTRKNGKTVTSSLTNRMNSFFAVLEGHMGPLDDSPLKSVFEGHMGPLDDSRSKSVADKRKAAVLALIKKVTPDVKETDDHFKSMLNRLVNYLGEAPPPAIAGITRPAPASPDDNRESSRRRIESDTDASQSNAH